MRTAQPPPQPQPPRRKHGGGRPRASPEAEAKVIAALEAGANAKTAAAAAGLAYPGPAVRHIWERHGGTWPAPGVGTRPPGKGRPPRALTGQQAAGAARRVQQAEQARRQGQPAETKTAIAEAFGVSRQTLYRAIERLKDSSEEERG